MIINTARYYTSYIMIIDNTRKEEEHQYGYHVLPCISVDLFVKLYTPNTISASTVPSTGWIVFHWFNSAKVGFSVLIGRHVTIQKGDPSSMSNCIDL